MPLVRRILLELLAARKLQARDGLALDEALDRLSQELDINCMSAAPDNEQYRDQLAELLSDLDDAGHSAESAVAFWDAFGVHKPGRPPPGAWRGPAWLIDGFISRVIPE